METHLRRPRSNDYLYDDERLTFVIRATGLTVTNFGLEIGLTYGDETLYEIRCGRMPLTPELVDRIVRRYPQIDRQWLLTGTAEKERQ